MGHLSRAPECANGGPNTLPAGLGVPQAEMDTVQALVCIGAIAAFVPTLRMAHTLKKKHFLHPQRRLLHPIQSPGSLTEHVAALWGWEEFPSKVVVL